MMTPMTYTLFADDEAPPQQQPGPPGGALFMPLMIGLLILFWVVVVLPASRRSKREQEQQLASVKRGTKIVTASGIVGIIVSAKDGEDEIVIKSEDTRLRIKRSGIAQVIGTDEAEAAKA